MLFDIFWPRIRTRLYLKMRPLVLSKAMELSLVTLWQVRTWFVAVCLSLPSHSWFSSYRVSLFFFLYRTTYDTTAMIRNTEWQGWPLKHLEPIAVNLRNRVFPHTVRVLCGPTISGLGQYNNFGFTSVTSPHCNSPPRSLYECKGFIACPAAGSISGSPVSWCCPAPLEIQLESPHYPRISVILAGDLH